jgi:hypothetical protein
MTAFRCREVVHVGVVIRTIDGDVVEYLTSDGSKAWLGLVDDDGRAVEYDGLVVRLVCEKHLGGLASVLLRRPSREAYETEAEVDCMACIALCVSP